MSILPIDSGRYGSREIKQIFEEKKRLQYQLKFEAAVAGAQLDPDNPDRCFRGNSETGQIWKDHNRAG